MKFKISMLFALIMSFYLNAQENIAQVEFETKLIDYGDIEFDSDGKRVFKFKNVGTAPLMKKKFRIRMAPTIIIFNKGIKEQTFKAGLDLECPVDLEELQESVNDVLTADKF